jgi:hypothetical protein
MFAIRTRQIVVSGASSAAPSNIAPSSTAADGQKAEPKRPETESVEPQVQFEIEKMEAQKRVSLLQT